VKEDIEKETAITGIIVYYH